MLEIERRFLLSETPVLMGADFKQIKQGYLTGKGGNSVVRVRHVKDQTTKAGYITIKARHSEGVSHEFEYEIPAEEADELLQFSVGNVVSKTRFEYGFNGHTFEIDFFENELHGLVIAEVELESVDEEVVLPDFIGREITHVKGVSNFDMANDPDKVLETLNEYK